MGHSHFVGAVSSFWTGLARTFDLGATLQLHSYNESTTPEEADARAIASDWRMVGEDLQRAIDAYKLTP